MNQPVNASDTESGDAEVSQSIRECYSTCSAAINSTIEKTSPAAEREARAALAIDGQHPMPRFMLGVICRELERDEEAEPLFRGLLDQPEMTAKVHNNLGLLAKRREDWTAAKDIFGRQSRPSSSSPPPITTWDWRC